MKCVKKLMKLLIYLFPFLQSVEYFEDTHKNIRQVAIQRCETLRGAFMAHSFLFQRKMFVWMDETGTDKRDSVRKFGYAIKGITPVYHRFFQKRTTRQCDCSNVILRSFSCRDKGR